MNTKGQKTPDDYLELVREFALRPIRSERQYDQAVKMLMELAARAENPGLSAGESDYYDALSRFIGDYEDAHFAIQNVMKTPIARLKYLMEQNEMNTTQLGSLLGSGPGQASMILNGKRELSKANIRTLAERFKINPGFFL